MTNPIDYYSLMRPDVQVLQRHFQWNQCGILTDNYRFPAQSSSTINVSSHSESLEDVRMETFTIPLPGYNDLYVWKDENWPSIDADSESSVTDDRPLYLWCGNLYHLTKRMFANTNAMGVFLGLPSTVDHLMNTFMSPDFYGITIHGFPPNVFVAAETFFTVGTFCSENEIGHIIMKQRYNRKEFLFLQSFDPQTWNWIFALLFTYSFIMTFIGFKSSVDHEKKSIKLIFTHWLDVMFQLVGALLMEGISEFEAYRRTLVSVWLLVCIVLIGCMQGSMRDLMSHALTPLEPQYWSEVFYNPDLTSLEVITSDAFPSWDAFYRLHENEINMAGERFLRIRLSFDFAEMISGMIQLAMAILGGLQKYIFLAFKRAYLMIFWLFLVYKPFLYRVLSILRDQSIDDDNVRETYDDLVGKITHGMYISPGEGKNQFILGLAPQTIPQVQRYINHL